MPLPRWNESLALGIPEIDNDHKYLIELLQRLIQVDVISPDREEVWRILSSLEQYATKHFAREEELMKNNQFEFLKSHTEEHKQMLLDTKMLTNDFLDNRASVSDILNFLEVWFLRHIAGSDTLLVNALKKSQPS